LINQLLHLYPFVDYEGIHHEIGWSDIAEEYRSTRKIMLRTNRIAVLTARLTDWKPLWEQHRGKDYWWWKKYLY